MIYLSLVLDLKYVLCFVTKSLLYSYSLSSISISIHMFKILVAANVVEDLGDDDTALGPPICVKNLWPVSVENYHQTSTATV